VGVVEAVGPGVDYVKPGDRVGYLIGPQGAYSQARVMPAEVLIPLPDGIADRTAATLMMKGMTAQYLLRQVYPLKGGETILYHAAAGGVGLIVCQWARALGVNMIGVVSTDEKAAIAKANGCAHTIVTARENIVERVKEITNGKGVPVVYDSVGKDTLMASLDCLQPRGALSNGTSSGPVVVDSQLLAVKGSIWMTRPAMMHYIQPRAHAGHGTRAVRPRAGRPHHQRAAADLRAGRCGPGTPRAGVAQDGGRDRPHALKYWCKRRSSHAAPVLPAHLEQGARDLPSEHTRTASISTSNTLALSITACCRRASMAGASGGAGGSRPGA
jgi:NADPH:quinone reductase-like Zn-dependent oxidoreductase